VYDEGIFTRQTLVILGAGIALGIIFKQQAEIRTLKHTLSFLQEIAR